MSQQRDQECEKRRLERVEKEKTHWTSIYHFGSIFLIKNELYCLQRGLDGKIFVDPRTGSWNFVVDVPRRGRILLVFDPTTCVSGIVVK